MNKNPRRKFITNLAAFSATFGFSAFFNSLEGKELLSVLESRQFPKQKEAETDEEFWRNIRLAFDIDSNLINLNNGGVSPSPKVVLEAVSYYNRLSNNAPSYYMWRIVNRRKERVREKLANLAGASPETIAINRNTTEGLETVIFGLTLKKGDEVILSKYDYPSMITAWKQRERRDGIKLIWVDFDFPMENKSLTAKKFTDLFTKKTRVVHITHMINWTGQILPVKEIADAAKKRNIEVIVDGAHTFGQLDFKIPDLNCDYFATSIHKWLCGPFGTGMLYVRKEKISDLYPLFSAPEDETEDIRKFEHLGTRSLGIEQAISQAIDFHNLIGLERKIQRLHYLKAYWINLVKDIPGVEILTSLNPEFGGSFGLIQLKDKNVRGISSKLLSDHNIHVVAIEVEKINGLRISPSVYTLTEELDHFAKALKKVLNV